MNNVAVVTDRGVNNQFGPGVVLSPQSGEKSHDGWPGFPPFFPLASWI